jgi:hypothetical protein
MLCVDKKSQIQALDRSQPRLPLKRGRSQTMTHAYKRNRTADLFAALNAANGEVYEFCLERHRHQEIAQVSVPTRPSFAHASRLTDRRQLRDPQTSQVQRWLQPHPRLHMHFTSTRASRLNMVQRFFRDPTQNQLRRGMFRDLEELFMAIGNYIDRHNENPKHFIWTARASDILEKLRHAGRALDKTSFCMTHYTSCSP